MKIGWLATAIILVLFVSAFAVSTTMVKGEKKDKIDPKVLGDAANGGKARVIIQFKNNGSEVSDRIGKEKISHGFSSMNGFSARLSADDLAKLEQDSNVENVYVDKQVHIDLQDSVPLINATETWALQDNGVNLTGLGQTVCIIDTGVDYTHPDLGGCTPVESSLNGTIESSVLQSAHPYVINYDHTWAITKPGYSQIAVHFRNLSTEATFDYVDIYDGNNRIVATYSGTHNNLWSPSVNGSTIYVRLRTDESINFYGFYIDQVINGTTNTTYDWSNCSKVIGGWDVVNSDPDPMDDEGHGTHVAGIVAANGDIKGVAPEAKIIAMKSMDSSGNGFTSDIVAGIEWCTNHSAELNISVISMSLGSDLSSSYCDGGDPLTAAAINSAVAKNISVVIAAGNDGSSSQISYPACIQNATPIGSTTKSDTISSFSNRNSLVQLFATGGTTGGEGSCTAGASDPSRICSTRLGGGYISMSGTSMATPHVAGAFAIANQFLKMQGTSKTPQQLEAAFNATGKIIHDADSGLNFSRIDIYDTIFYLDSAAPEVNLTTPENIANNTADAGLNLTVSCDVSDFALSNGTLYLWNESGIYNQTYASFSGQTGSIEMNVTALPEGSYQWNCLAYDLKGNLGTATSNRTIGYKLFAPNVTLINPADDSSQNAGAISFYYNVTDPVAISNCSLIANGNISKYNSSEVTNGTNIISKTLSAGNYSWSINCTDRAGNIGNSSTRNITINATPVIHHDGGGGGGGGGAGGAMNYIVTDAQMAQGFLQYASGGDKISMNLTDGSSAATGHIITITKLFTNLASITIQSNPINLNLSVGEEKKVNVTSSNYYDLYIKLNSIAYNKASLTIKSIYEPINNQTGANGSPVDNSTSIQNKSKGRIYTIQYGNESGSTGDGLTLKISLIVGAVILVAFLFWYFHKQYNKSVKQLHLHSNLFHRK